MQHTYPAHFYFPNELPAFWMELFTSGPFVAPFGATYLKVVGQSVDRKSSVCPNPVKGLSNHEEKYRVCPIKYRVCQKSVESMSNQNDPGQRLETKIQYLSRHCPTKKFREADSDLLQSLDKHWTWTNFGQGAYFRSSKKDDF